MICATLIKKHTTTHTGFDQLYY